MNHDITNSSAETKYCHSCGGFISGIYAGNPSFCRCNQDEKLERELAQKTNEVARLREELERAKEIVMDAAKRGDEMAAHWKERAEKAEALVKQIHHYAGIIEGFQNK